MGVRLRVTLLKEGQVTQVKEEGGEREILTSTSME